MQNVLVLVESDRDLLRRFVGGGRVSIDGAHASNTATTPLARMLIIFTEPAASQCHS
jgi:hypothetical protein